jgi:hypothetical protein
LFTFLLFDLHFTVWVRTHPGFLPTYLHRTTIQRRSAHLPWYSFSRLLEILPCFVLVSYLGPRLITILISSVGSVACIFDIVQRA